MTARAGSDPGEPEECIGRMSVAVTHRANVAAHVWVENHMEIITPKPFRDDSLSARLRTVGKGSRCEIVWHTRPRANRRFPHVPMRGRSVGCGAGNEASADATSASMHAVCR